MYVTNDDAIILKLYINLFFDIKTLVMRNFSLVKQFVTQFLLQRVKGAHSSGQCHALTSP